MCRSVVRVFALRANDYPRHGIFFYHSSAPQCAPYAVAAVLTIGIGWLADRTGKRGLCNMGISLLGVVGFAMLLGKFGLTNFPDELFL